MASFPHAKKTFTQAVNGITKLVASLFNQPYDEIEAIQTAFGPLGCTSQSYTDSLKNLLLDYIQGCKVTYSDVAEIKVAAGMIAIPDASGNVRWRRNTAETTVNWANIDTGAEGNATQYYIYARADSAATTFTVIISTNATTPTGGTFYRLIGQFYNNASGNIEQVYGKHNISLGAWEDRTTSYGAQQAVTDGFVKLIYTGGGSWAFFTDGNANPILQLGGTDTHASDCLPVRKGDYWKVTVTSGSPVVYWISNGGY